MSSQACPENGQNKEGWGMPGGFSSPHDPTSEELFILKKAWFEAVSKCAHLPKEIEKVKVCSVRKQGKF